MKKTYIILVGIMVLAFPSLVNALEFKSCPEEIRVGEELTLELKETDDINEGDSFRWLSTNSGFATVNPKSDTLSATIKGVSIGTVSITASTDQNEVSCEMKVKAAKSNDATLKKLAVEDFELSPEFKKDTLEYKVKVDSKTTKVKITGEATDENATPKEISKEVTLDKDNMEAKIKVTAEDGETTKTYVIKFEVSEEKKEVKDFTLKSVKITGAEIDPKFDKDTLKYTLNVKDGEKPKVSSYESTDPNAQVFVASNDKGITITVTDGKNEKKYEFLLPQEEKEKSVYLSKLEIVAYPFEEAFDKDVALYTATIPYEVEEITLEAIAEDSDAKVTNTSLKNLKVGRNQITVTVKNGNKSKVYTIYVIRSEEEKLDEKTTSIITTGKNKKDSKSDYDIPDVDNPDTTLNLITVTVASIILFASGVIGIIFFIKTSPKRLKKEVFNKHEAKKASPLVEAKAKEDTELNNE